MAGSVRKETKGRVSEVVTGTELKKLKEDFFLVRGLVSVPANVEQVDRATVVGLLMSAENRLRVIYRQLLGEETESGTSLIGVPMIRFSGSMTEHEKERGGTKPIVDYVRSPRVRKPKKEAETEEKPKEEPKPKKDTQKDTKKDTQEQEGVAQKELDFTQKKGAARKSEPVPKACEGMRRLSEVLVSWGNVAHPTVAEASLWCEFNGVKYYFHKYYLTPAQVDALAKEYGIK